jgi:tetratricopeptide (TPR) repeat protein
MGTFQPVSPVGGRVAGWQPPADSRRAAEQFLLAIRGLRGDGWNPPESSAEALARFDYVVSRAPRFAPGFLYRGQARLMMGRTSEALDDFRAAVAVDGELAEARRWSAVALEDLGRPDEALGEAEAALIAAPDYPEAKALRARLRGLLDSR